MRFEKDLFISYAHLDNEALGDEDGWVSEFHKSLQIRLSQILGKQPVIWRDKELQGNSDFDPEIVSQFAKLRAIISILTPRYVQSEWCVKEVEEFKRAASNSGVGLTINNRSRIFKVVKTPVELDKHPEDMQNLLGYEFFKRDDRGRPIEFSRLYGKEGELAFYQKLNDLAYDIADLLKEIEDSSGPEDGPEISTSDTPATHKPTGKGKIFLAETGYDLREHRAKVRRELENAGFEVVPKGQLPFYADELVEEVNSMFTEVDMSIHLIGASSGITPDYGNVSEGMKRSMTELTNDLAAEYCQSNAMKRLIWIMPNLKVEDVDQEDFIERLRRAPVAQTGAELVESPLEDFKDTIFDTLAKMEEERRAAEEAKKAKEAAAAAGATMDDEDDDGPKYVYLICDQRDEAEIDNLYNYLYDQGFEVILPVFEGDETQIREDHIENLKLCDSVVIYYGHANDLWMRAKTRELLKAKGYGRTKPILSKAIYLAGPETPSKKRFRSHDSIVINGMNGVIEDSDWADFIRETQG
ncbi:MAG TPA: hypothetical protein DCP28_32670 [Cytophagales bacterium]|nr:hypothetical protein [Cytophagales bacterium]